MAAVMPCAHVTSAIRPLLRRSCWHVWSLHPALPRSRFVSELRGIDDQALVTK
uniref:Uncharacterized protein n=1 Tax=Zea mays TaxID=4577 RepID=B6SGZ7_MAIZE|nr:hypothetical protein [Zea mays]